MKQYNTELRVIQKYTRQQVRESFLKLGDSHFCS